MRDSRHEPGHFVFFLKLFSAVIVSYDGLASITGSKPFAWLFLVMFKLNGEVEAILIGQQFAVVPYY